ncbi:MAG: 4-(cytidine 5'-diphospho)-2-C-methyl-D-erythritol kinase [Tepidisphaeraceae bacterium]
MTRRHRDVMRLLAPAKINLDLRVAPRADEGPYRGYHPLRSWMCTVGLFDTLTITRIAGSTDGTQGPLVRLTCDDPALPCDGRNLVVRAGEALGGALRSPQPGGTARHAEGEGAIAAAVGGTRAGDVGGDGCVTDATAGLPGKPAPVSGALSKRIPSGAGLGGGSSDGARMLLGLNRMWGAGWDRSRVAELAAALGSDVPFFCFGPSAMCEGRGERVMPVEPPRRARFAVLLLPRLALATPLVYKRFDELRLGNQRTVADAPSFGEWAQLPAPDLLARLRNDLEPAAFSLSPELGDLRAGLEATLDRPVRMSGSGSSLFTLYETMDEAMAGTHVCRSRYYDVEAMAIDVAPDFVDDVNDAGG